MSLAKTTLRFFLTTNPAKLQFDLAMLILRVCVGFFMLAGHGWGKLVNFSDRMYTFADPIGLGSPTSLGLAVFAEVFCAIAVMAGLLTRFALIPLIITMLVAAFIAHASDPLFGAPPSKEMALLFLVPFVALFLTGPGRFSADAFLARVILR